MFEPQLDHNLADFRRMSRGQLRILLASPVCGVIVFTLVAVLALPRWAEGLAFIALLGSAGIGLGVLEIKKIIIFRRDLRELRGAGMNVDTG